MIDKIDKQLIELLAENGRTTLNDLSKKVGLSVSPCQSRIKKLEEQKYILGYHAQINYQKLEKAHVAFVQVSLSNTRARALEEFNVEVGKLQAVEQCHMIAGGFDYLLKVRTTDIDSYRLLLAEKISSLPYVASTSTFVSMQSVKDSK
ncbi:MAG: Lrp/AsnC family transcriptional regulator [Paracoccaceae bacterium]